jgi:hypothetical protein
MNNPKDLLLEAAEAVRTGKCAFCCVAICQTSRIGDPAVKNALELFSDLYKPKIDTPLNVGWFGTPRDQENQIKRVEALIQTANSIHG